MRTDGFDFFTARSFLVRSNANTALGSTLEGSRLRAIRNICKYRDRRRRKSKLDEISPSHNFERGALTD